MGSAIWSIFTMRRYAKRGTCRRRVSVRPSVCLCVCVSVCLSVTLRYCMKKSRITQKMLSASGGFAPHPLTRGSTPGPRWGLRPQIPAIHVGSRSTLAMTKFTPMTKSPGCIRFQRLCSINASAYWLLSAHTTRQLILTVTLTLL